MFLTKIQHGLENGATDWKIIFFEENKSDKRDTDVRIHQVFMLQLSEVLNVTSTHVYLIRLPSELPVSLRRLILF